MNEKTKIVERRPRRKLIVPNKRYKSDSEQTTNGKQMSLVYVFPEPEYEEFFDVTFKGKNYRIFVGKNRKLIWGNEIVSYNYDGKGSVLLKNPKLDDDRLLEMNEVFEKVSDSEKRHTLRSFFNQQIKKLDEKDARTKRKEVGRGRLRELYIIEATAKSIRKFDRGNDRREVVRGLFQKTYKTKAHSESSFVKSVINLWDEVMEACGDYEKDQEKNLFSFKKDAQKYLKNLRNACKQRAKKSEPGKN